MHADESQEQHENEHVEKMHSHVHMPQDALSKWYNAAKRMTRQWDKKRGFSEKKNVPSIRKEVNQRGHFDFLDFIIIFINVMIIVINTVRVIAYAFLHIYKIGVNTPSML